MCALFSRMMTCMTHNFLFEEEIRPEEFVLRQRKEKSPKEKKGIRMYVTFLLLRFYLAHSLRSFAVSSLSLSQRNNTPSGVKSERSER